MCLLKLLGIYEINYMEKEKVHYYWFDLLRFLAALVVVLSHFRGAFFVEYSLLPESQQNALVFVFYSLTRLGNRLYSTKNAPLK